jgi:hypothetical protein
MNLHTPSLAVGAALMVGVGLLSAQNIVGSPSVEVRVLQVPALRMLGPEHRQLEAPVLNGSNQYVVQAGEVIDLSDMRIQFIGDGNWPAKANFHYSINGGHDNSAGSVNTGSAGSHSFGIEGFRATAGDVLEFFRVPYGDSSEEGDPNFSATIILQAERI